MLSLFKRKDKSNINDNQSEKLKFLTNKNIELIYNIN